MTKNAKIICRALAYVRYEDPDTKSVTKILKGNIFLCHPDKYQSLLAMDGLEPLVGEELRIAEAAIKRGGAESPIPKPIIPPDPLAKKPDQTGKGDGEGGDDGNGDNPDPQYDDAATEAFVAWQTAGDHQGTPAEFFQTDDGRKAYNDWLDRDNKGTGDEFVAVINPEPPVET